MELFKYIVKFIYRIRWWMVIFPCIAGIIAWFLTRNLEKTYAIMELTLIETNAYLELKRKLSTLSVQMADFQKKIAPSSPEK